MNHLCLQHSTTFISEDKSYDIHALSVAFKGPLHLLTLEISDHPSLFNHRRNTLFEKKNRLLPEFSSKSFWIFEVISPYVLNDLTKKKYENVL